MIDTDDVSVLLGAVVQPKTKEPIWVKRKLDTYRTVEIFVGHSYQDIIGEGYLDGGDMGDEYLNSVNITGFPRSHTPQGIRDQYRNLGFGTCLYTGLVLIASAIADGQIAALPSFARRKMPGKGKGICSDSESRSSEASVWWSSAVDRGLASQEDATYANDEDSRETETLTDEDLWDYMSMRSRTRVQEAIDEAINNYSEWSLASSVSLRGDVERSVDNDSGRSVTADYYTLTSAEKHKLVAVRETFKGRLDQWAKAPLTDEGEYFKDVILALNVSKQSPVVIGKLAACALDRGASEVEVTAMIMRNRFGVDLLDRAIGHTSVADMKIGRRTEFDTGGVMVGNPRRRRVPMHEPRPVEPVRNPAPSSSEQRELERSLDKLERLRDDLGWNKLEDLP